MWELEHLGKKMVGKQLGKCQASKALWSVKFETVKSCDCEFTLNFEQ